MPVRKSKIWMEPDGSIVHEDGRILFFSLERFRRDIVAGECCFICGTSPAHTGFNDEHVIPDWILDELHLKGKRMGLPNATNFGYARYKIPCCTACNSLLGKKFEEPVSDLLKSGYGNLSSYVSKEGPWLLYIWLALIFFKTYLKDRFLRLNLDARLGSEKIADIYDWNTMHHIHCLVRAVYTKVSLDRRIIGSFFSHSCENRKTF
jgi:hypothetical protein